jgi:hypothetical protein
MSFSCRELTWLRDALIKFKLSSCVPDVTGATRVQNFFLVLHDLWCAEKASREWLGARAATGTNSKSPLFGPNAQLPSIVEMTLAAKLSDPDESMGIRGAIEYFLFDEMLDKSMITFLQDILQRVSPFNIRSIYPHTRRHQLTKAPFSCFVVNGKYVYAY